MTAMFTASTMSLWVAVLTLSIAADVGATAYLQVAGERWQGVGFLGASVLGVLVFAPSIVAFGYALRLGPSYIATVGIWAVGVYAANALVGALVFGDPWSWRTVLGIAAGCAAVVLLSPTA
jgi:drug/metabolite transporter (DMT)-like permease